jgi:DTW domain-containing protein YfiP
MLGGLCVCALIPSPPLATRTHLVLIIHRLELRKPTNTGTLAAACLASHELVVRGHADQPSSAVVVPAGRRPILLFPHETARELPALAPFDEPVTLIVPDGTWRQAQKVRQRVPGLAELPCATLPPGPPSRYRLRAEPDPSGLSTMEAIARAYGVLEGPAIEAALLEVFTVMVERTLWARGQLAAKDVTGGIPEGLQRHAPTPAIEVDPG